MGLRDPTFFMSAVGALSQVRKRQLRATFCLHASSWGIILRPRNSRCTIFPCFSFDPIPYVVIPYFLVTPHLIFIMHYAYSINNFFEKHGKALCLSKRKMRQFRTRYARLGRSVELRKRYVFDVGHRNVLQ